MANRKLTGAIIVLLALSGVGCIPRDLTTGGPVSTRSYDVAGFTAVKVSSSDTGKEVYHRFVVEILPSDTFSVTVAANDNLFPFIHVTHSGETLQIELREVQVSFAPATLEARIAMPQLWQLSAYGAADVTARGFKSSHDFNLELSDGSNAELDLQTGIFRAVAKDGRARGIVSASDAHIEVYGTSGAVEFRGSGRDLVLRGGSGSETVLDQFPVRNADVTFMGLGTHASLAINGQLDVTLGSATSLSYSGNATLGRTSIGPGAILRQKP